MLHYYKLKRRYNSDLIKYILTLFKAALVIKLLVSIWLFPRGEIFPEDKKLETIFEIKDIVNFRILWVQVKRAAPLFGVLVLTLLGLILDFYLLRMIEFFYGKIFG